MDDDEDLKYVKRAKTIHYGSLEEAERRKATEGPSTSAGPSTSTSAGNINVSHQYMKIEQPKMTTERQLVLDEFERKRKARQITVSVDDHQVQAHLRHLEEPICEC